MKEIGNIKLVYTSSEFGFKLGKPNNDRHQSGSPTGVEKIGGGALQILMGGARGA